MKHINCSKDFKVNNKIVKILKIVKYNFEIDLYYDNTIHVCIMAITIRDKEGVSVPVLLHLKEKVDQETLCNMLGEYINSSYYHMLLQANKIVVNYYDFHSGQILKKE